MQFSSARGGGLSVDRDETVDAGGRRRGASGAERQAAAAAAGSALIAMKPSTRAGGGADRQAAATDQGPLDFASVFFDDGKMVGVALYATAASRLRAPKL